MTAVCLPLFSPKRPFRFPLFGCVMAFPPSRPQRRHTRLAQVLSRLPALKAGTGGPALTAPSTAVALPSRAR
jgi:hypothetical protein